LPDSSADEEVIAQHEDLLHWISTPVSDEEAVILARLFGPDDCYGLAWTLLHLIETAPGWPIASALSASDNPWIATLRRRGSNAGERRR
jgi:hypothetical protein